MQCIRGCRALASVEWSRAQGEQPGELPLDAPRARAGPGLSLHASPDTSTCSDEAWHHNVPFALTHCALRLGSADWSLSCSRGSWGSW